ncbi:DUF1127 domain-containing protein [Rhodobacteraceae bacterium F11138]|nr:DUF1127 domain-containing protein [Rhodobacteraceae bacterium F11138]
MYLNLRDLNYFSPIQPVVHGPRERASADGRIRKWFRTAYRNWRRNKMIAALQSLDDATLRDIGVLRGNIHNIVDQFDDHELNMTPIEASCDARTR